MPVSKHEYITNKFDFASLLAEPLTIDGVCFLDGAGSKDDLQIDLLKENLQEIRNRVFEVLLGKSFQNVLENFTKHLASTHFTESAYFQKVPSIRLYLPNALGTSWHTDNWYGHGIGVHTFWIPVTNVLTGAGVSFINNEKFLNELESKLHSGELSLSEINSLCATQGEEFTCGIGEYLKFNSRTLHGSVGNSSDNFRCSFDFRGSPVSAGVGNKPLFNYRVIDKSNSKPAVENFNQAKAVKYISGATGASTKYQHILLEAYARENGMDIVRNEAEIESVATRPVLGAYAKRAVPDSESYNHILIYSMRTLSTDVGIRKKLLEDCRNNNLYLHFALEDLVFSKNMSIEKFLKEAEKYVVQSRSEDEALVVAG